MIISVSRRTDVPALYFDWFMNRLREGFALVPNPMNPKRISRVRLQASTIDCLVFWTKNGWPMLKHLDALEEMGYPYYIQYTVTPYGTDLEPGIDKGQALAGFEALSERLGRERMVWRYDPILLNERYTVERQLALFERLCTRLAGRARHCVFSFVDDYKKLTGVRREAARALSERQMHQLARGMSEIARARALPLKSCSEVIDLSAYGVEHSACIDRALVEDLTGTPLRVSKDRNQRPACGCVDVGSYECCTHRCAYCYANANWERSFNNARRHDPASPMLIGWPQEGALISERPMKKLRSK